MRKLLFNNYEVSTDNKVVWVNDERGCLARYSGVFGYEIYTTNQCGSEKEWKEFVSACQKEFGILIPDHFSPLEINEPQPPPKGSIYPFVWDLVRKDMEERDLAGFQKYLTRLQPHNGRDALIDAYQEALDLVVYLRQFIYEQRGS